MASVRINKPGTKYGPCKNQDCGHVDCAASRHQVESVCPICLSKIGFDRSFTAHPDKRTADGKYVICHTSCLEDELAPVRNHTLSA